MKLVAIVFIYLFDFLTTGDFKIPNIGFFKKANIPK